MTQRCLEELLDLTDPAWPLIQQLIDGARRPIEVLPAERSRGEATLLWLQVTARSSLGAMALETGGILFDHGWLRFLGSGSERMTAGLAGWGDDGSDGSEDPLPGALIVAHDVLGGFFAINRDGFLGERGAIFYLPPDTLVWEQVAASYSELLRWAATGDLDEFYRDSRWPGWEREVAALTGDQGLWIYPPLFIKSGGSVGDRARGPVPMTDLWQLQYDLGKQLRDLSPGARAGLAGVQ